MVHFFSHLTTLNISAVIDSSCVLSGDEKECYTQSFLCFRLMHQEESCGFCTSPPNGAWSFSLFSHFRRMLLPANYVKLIETTAPATRRARALFDFTSRDSSELTFEAADNINILQSDSVWWEGELNGRVGLFSFILSLGVCANEYRLSPHGTLARCASSGRGVFSAGKITLQKPRTAEPPRRPCVMCDVVLLCV